MEFSYSAKISPHYSAVLGRLGAAAPGDPSVSDIFAALNKQCTPSHAEEAIDPCELDDPLGEAASAVTGRLFVHHQNRALLKITGECFSHCRFCICRKPAQAPAADGAEPVEQAPAAHKTGIEFISSAELSEACAFLAEHAEINEITISGGDPLILPDEKLIFIFESLRKARPGILIRLCTRAPVFAPERITRETLALFRRYRPFWVTVHINHPAEISGRWSPEAQRSLFSFVDAGIPVQSETVLLRGVNDSAEVLSELFTLLVHLGVKPAYLYQAGLAKGTGHFRVPLSEGLELYGKLKNELSDLALPEYVRILSGGDLERISATPSDSGDNA